MDEDEDFTTRTMAEAMEDYDEDEIDDWRPKSKKKKKGIFFSNIVYAL
ncbi:MAG: hypothetical protein MJE68_30605 [Proteobacteria bacterium]|nr:hypothetical protein [Pseudomonadota bacterium]